MIEALGAITLVLVDIYLLQLISSHIRMRKEAVARVKEEKTFEIPPSLWSEEA